MIRKLERITKDRTIGVCEGIGEYTDTDPILWRILFIFGTLFTIFPFILFYIILWVVLPIQ